MKKEEETDAKVEEIKLLERLGLKEFGVEYSALEGVVIGCIRCMLVRFL